jgi:acyl carrier protein
MTTREKLIQAFATGLGVPESSEVPMFEYRKVLQWDSMAHMQLVAEIEAAFDIMLDTEEVLGLSSFSVALEILSKHGINATA